MLSPLRAPLFPGCPRCSLLVCLYLACLLFDIQATSLLSPSFKVVYKPQLGICRRGFLWNLICTYMVSWAFSC